MTPANEMLATIEMARKAAGLSQAQLADALGMTQGHYSKIVASKVPAGRKAQAAMSAWLERAGLAEPGPKARQIEIKRLAEEIVMQCMRLARLAADGS